jgi:hypothetical protein
MRSLRYGQRADIRDRLLLLLSDGKQWHIRDLTKALAWPKTTNITKVLNETKLHLVMTGDPRRLHKESFNNCRKGTLWRLTSNDKN